MSVEWDEVLEFARDQWGGGLRPTPTNLHAAAVGLVSSWYRNTVAVEQFAHAEGPWSDADMMRKNAWATELARSALTQVAEVADDLEAVEPVLEDLLEELASMLPTERAQEELRTEKQNAPYVAIDWVEANGLGNWLAFLTNVFAFPNAWWGAPGYPSIVDRYCALDPGPPDAGSFRMRMLSAPWELSDAQAEFVCRYRYDVR